MIELLLRNLEDAFDGRGWHGPTLRGALRGLSPDEAAWRPAPGRHCIWEVAVHAAYWKYAVRRRLTGERRGSFRRKGSNWFPAPRPATAAAWRDDVALLDSEHGLLREAVAAFPAERLSRRAGRSDYDYAKLIYGVAAHDVYHAGQIRLLKRLRRA